MSIKEKIGLRLFSWRKSEAANGRVALPSAAKNAKTVCIILPANFDDFDIVRTILPDILDKLSYASLTIWVRENYRSWLIVNETSTILNYDPSEATRFGLPDSDVVRRIKSKEYDLLLDLTLNPELYVAGLAKEVRASMKIGLAHPITQEMYNLLVESNSPDNGRRLMALLNYL